MKAVDRARILRTLKLKLERNEPYESQNKMVQATTEKKKIEKNLQEMQKEKLWEGGRGWRHFTCRSPM
jgi:hypothetical protein